MGAQLLGGDARSGLQPDDGGDLLAEGRVGRREDGSLQHSGVLEQDRFHLERRDVLAPSDNDVLGAIDDIEEAFLVEAPDVPGVEPAVGERRCRLLRTAPIARDDVRTLDPDLPGVSRRRVVAVLVDDANLADRYRGTDAVGPGQVVVAADRRGDRGCLRQAVPGAGTALGEAIADATEELGR